MRGIAEEDARGAILEIIPHMRSTAMTLEQIVEATHISRATAQRVIEKLVESADLRVTGRGTKGSPKRYWAEEDSDDEVDEQEGLGGNDGDQESDEIN